MGAGHRDIQIGLMNPQRPRAVQRRSHRHPKPGTGLFRGCRTWKSILALSPHPGDGGNCFCIQINFPNHMVLNIGHIQHIFMQRHSLGVVKRCRIISTIVTSDGSGTNNVLYLALQVGNNNSIVTAVAHVQFSTFLIRKNFSRVFQWCRFDCKVL